MENNWRSDQGQRSRDYALRCIWRRGVDKLWIVCINFNKLFVESSGERQNVKSCYDASDLAVALRDHRPTRLRELAPFRAAPWARAAIACSRNACTRRRRSEALAHTRPMRLAKEEASGTGSLASDRPSGHGGAQSGISDTPSPRSTMTAIASPPSISKDSRGRIPALRR